MYKYELCPVKDFYQSTCEYSCRYKEHSVKDLQKVTFIQGGFFPLLYEIKMRVCPLKEKTEVVAVTIASIDTVM